jgi:hypothetical protein
MSPRAPNITAITGNYDAIERAIRETSRGRWFLTAYLERNRSAETHMLLDAIARLESAMRENGHVVENYHSMEPLTEMRDRITVARQEIAHTRRRKGAPAWLPVPRFTFESLPDVLADETRAIKAAAANLENAAQALRTAGVFHGVAQQISERIEDILEACEMQNAATHGLRRMAQLVSELEAEIMGSLDGDTGSSNANACSEENNTFSIPSEVIAELSAALAEGFADDIYDEL